MQEINNRYRLLELAGKGGMGHVYRVEDKAKDDRIIALKTLLKERMTRSRLNSFKREFKTLSKLSHPNLEDVYDYGKIRSGPKEEEGSYFFTSEYLKGFSPEPSNLGESWKLLCVCAIQVCRALQFIHSHNLIHYDIKPENILIASGHSDDPDWDELDPDDIHVKLIDFGLADEQRTTGGLSIRGTVPYIAPEIIRGDPVDGRADLYSLGATLFEIITGDIPFDGESSTSVLRSHLEEHPPKPRKLNQDIPDELEQLIIQLLQKEPQARPRDANHVIKTLSRIAGLSYQPETKETIKGYVSSSLFVGRDQELSWLKDMLKRVEEQKEGARFAIVSGEAGIGKSRLFKEFQVWAQTHNYPVLFGKGQQHGTRAFGVVRDLLKKFIRQVEVWEHSGEHAPDLVEEYVSYLAKIVPGISEQYSVEELPSLDEEEEILRLLDKTAEFMMRATAGQTVVIGVEDLQWADEMSVKLLEHLSRKIAISPESNRLLLVASRRTDWSGNGHSESFEQLFNSGYVKEKSLSPFTVEEAKTFITSMFGEAGETIAQSVVEREESGNPLFVEELLGSLIDLEVLVRSDTGWELDVDRWEKLEPPEKVEDVLQMRLEGLDEESSRLLQYITAWGGAISYQDMASVIPEEAQVSEQRIAELFRRGILRQERDDGEEQIRLAHNRMGETIRERMKGNWPEVCRTLLSGLEDQIQEQCEDRRERTQKKLSDYSDFEEEHLERLARFSWEAEDESRFLHYGKEAARYAEASHAYEQAFQLYKRFLNLDLEGKEQVEILEKLGNIRKLQANLSEADQYYQEAIERSGEDDISVDMRILSKRAEIFESVGKVESSEKCYREAIQLFEEKGDRENAALCRQYVETKISYGWFCAERKSEFEQGRRHNEEAVEFLNSDYIQDSDKRKSLLADAQRNFGMIDFRLGEYEQSLNHLQKAYEVYRELGMKRGEARTTGNIGLILRALGQYEQAVSYFQECQDICKDIDDRLGEARVCGNLGLVYRDLRDVEQALSYLKRCYRISKETGDRQGVGNAAANIGLLYWNRRNVKEALRYYREHLEVSEEIGYRRGVAKASANIGGVKEEKGELDEAMTYYERSLTTNKEIGEKKGEAIALINIARILYHRAELEKARSNATRGRKISQEIEYEAGVRSALSCLSDIYSAQGSYKKAMKTCEKALATAREIEAGFAEVDLMFQKGKILARTGRVGDACDNLEKLLGKAEERGVNKRFIAEVQLELAKCKALQKLRYGQEECIPDQKIKPSLFASNKWEEGKQLYERSQNVLKGIEFFRYQLESKFVKSLYQLSNFEVEPVVAQLSEIEERATNKGFRIRARQIEDVRSYIQNLSIEEVKSTGNVEEIEGATPTRSDESSFASFQFLSEETRKVFQLIRDLTADLDPEVLFQRILDTAIEITGAEKGILAVPPSYEDREMDVYSSAEVEETDDLLIKVARSRGEEPYDVARDELPMELMLTVYRDRDTYVWNGEEETQKEPRKGHNRSASVFDIPLMSQGRALGLLHLEDPDRSGVFSQQDRFFISYLAVHAGMALKNTLLHEQAIKDRLSGLYTNNYFKRRFYEEIKIATRFSRSISLLMMDVDGFKQINDLMGHTAGDWLIKRIGSILKEQLRGYDISARSDSVAGRYGGDEFEVLLPGAETSDAAEVAERILDGVKEADLTYDGEEMDVSISIGIATYPKDGSTVSELIEAADEAMLKIKKKGGDDYFSFSQAEREARDNKREWMRYSEIGQHFISRSRMKFKSLLTDVIGSEMEVDKMLEITLKMVVQAINARSGYVVTEDGSGNLQIKTRHFSQEKEQEAEISEEEQQDMVSRQLVKRAMNEGKGVLVENASENPAFDRYQTVDELDLRSVLVVPVRAGDRQIGVIYLENSAIASRFDEEDLSLVSALAREISGPLEAAQEHEKKVSELEEMKKRYRHVQENLQTRYDYDNIVGSSEAMQEVFQTLDKVTPTSLNVLIEGETGTGKELAARSIHYNGPRNEQPFLAVNCARFSETLLESELFGHKKGSFTGADQDRAGLFEQADQGTLFLDEISEMSPDMQARLLRVLETGEVRRIGDDQSRDVDVRIISATNQPLEDMMDEGTFRRDLYYRLADAHVQMPPLDERKEDIPELIDFFLEQLAKEENTEKKKIEEEAVMELARRDWPGNVRQLRSKVRQLAMFAGSREHIRAKDLSSDKPRRQSTNGVPLQESEDTAAASQSGEKSEQKEKIEEVRSLEEVERTGIKKALSAAEGNKKKAAELLGIHYTTLYRKLKKFDLEEE